MVRASLRLRREMGVLVSDDTYTPPKLPTYAIFGTVGKVRVVAYDRDGRFFVVDSKDERRYVHRDKLRFLK